MPIISAAQLSHFSKYYYDDKLSILKIASYSNETYIAAQSFVANILELCKDLVQTALQCIISEQFKIFTIYA